MRRSTVKTTTENDRGAELPEALRAEAAVWVARLHSDVRSDQTERGFRAWLAEDPQHGAAFERLTNTWEATDNLRRGRLLERPRNIREAQRASRRNAITAITAAAACAAGVSALLIPSASDPRREVIETALGERRSVSLSDGSRVMLNTASRVVIAYTPSHRTLTLEKGQARFDVARNIARPFVVRAGGQQIIALGTAFDVRWTDAQLSIVLFEGRVAVIPANEPPSALGGAGVTLEPGERLQFAQPVLAVKSEPQLEREEAWVSGRAIFNSTPLSDAVDEMNRYTRRKLQLSDPELAALEISGTFSVDDAEAFARALAEIFSLEIQQTGDAIVVSPPRV